MDIYTHVIPGMDEAANESVVHKPVEPNEPAQEGEEPADPERFRISGFFHW